MNAYIDTKPNVSMGLYTFRLPGVEQLTLSVWNSDESWLGYVAKLKVAIRTPALSGIISEFEKARRTFKPIDGYYVFRLERAMWWVSDEYRDLHLISAKIPQPSLSRRVMELLEVYHHQSAECPSLPPIPDLHNTEWRRMIRRHLRYAEKRSGIQEQDPTILFEEDRYYWLWKYRMGRGVHLGSDSKEPQASE